MTVFGPIVGSVVCVLLGCCVKKIRNSKPPDVENGLSTDPLLRQEIELIKERVDKLETSLGALRGNQSKVSQEASHPCPRGREEEINTADSSGDGGSPSGS